jgi:lipopolysaccharide biosynthesis regulator YciM
MDRSDIRNVLRDNLRKSDAVKDAESTTMNRLHELHIRGRGSARQQQYAGRQRRIVYQHNTGTVGRYTLTDILGEKSEHLWTCPVCNEDDMSTKLN